MNTLLFFSFIFLMFVLSLIYIIINQMSKIEILKKIVIEDITDQAKLELRKESDKPLDIPYIKLHPNSITPSKAHNDETGMDAGFDLYCLEDTVINSTVTKIPTGIAFGIPIGWYGMIVDKSGLASKDIETHGGIIDSGYLGDVQVMLKTNTEYKFEKGQKVAQIVFLPVPKVNLQLVDKLSETSRGATGFGASGK